MPCGISLEYFARAGAVHVCCEICSKGLIQDRSFKIGTATRYEDSKTCDPNRSSWSRWRTYLSIPHISPSMSAHLFSSSAYVLSVSTTTEMWPAVASLTTLPSQPLYWFLSRWWWWRWSVADRGEPRCRYRWTCHAMAIAVTVTGTGAMIVLLGDINEIYGGRSSI